MSQTPSQPTPQELLMQLMYAPMVTRSVWAAAELGIPDRLADGPKGAAALAAELGLHEETLDRLLCALCMVGVFQRSEAGECANSALGEQLRSGVPGSMRDYMRYASHLSTYVTWDHLLDVLRTGEPVWQKAHGRSMWESLEADPDLGGRFHRAMASLTSGVVRAFLAAVDLTGVKSLCDVGGGQGAFIGHVLAAHPGLKGVLFDLPSGIERAPALLDRLGVRDRCELSPGSFFESVPAGHDRYVMKHILHDWSDAESEKILGVVRAAMGEGSRLWLFEAVLPDGGAPHLARLLDLHMRVALGGRERTQSQWCALLERSGFALDGVLATASPFSVIVASRRG